MSDFSDLLATILSAHFGQHAQDFLSMDMPICEACRDIAGTNPIRLCEYSVKEKTVDFIWIFPTARMGAPDIQGAKQGDGEWKYNIKVVGRSQASEMWSEDGFFQEVERIHMEDPTNLRIIVSGKEDSVSKPAIHKPSMN